VNSEASSTSPSSSAPDKSFLSSSAPVDCFMEFDEDDVADDVYMKVELYTARTNFTLPSVPFCNLFIR